MRHGTLTAATTYRCPCQPCRDVQYRYTKQWQIARSRGHKHKVDAAPTHRKIQALAAMGHTYTSIARQARYAGPAAITNMLGRDLIRATTEVRIEEAFQAMHMRIPPVTREGLKVKAAARKRGWKTPMAYDDIHQGILAPKTNSDTIKSTRLDHDVVEEFLQYAQWKRRVSRLEKIEIMRRWIANGRSEAELCRLTGWRPGRYGRGFQHELPQS